MNTYLNNLIVIDGASNFRIKTYLVSGVGFTEIGATATESGWTVDGSQQIGFNDDRSAVYFSAGASGPFRTKVWRSDIVGGVAQDAVELSTTVYANATSAQCLQVSGDVIALGANRAGADHLFILDVSDASTIWSGQLPATFSDDCRNLLWISSTRLLAIDGTNGYLALYSWDGAALTLLDSELTDFGSILAHAPDGNVWTSDGSTVYLVSVAGDVISTVTSRAGTYGTSGTQSHLGALPQRDLVLTTDGATISTETSFLTGTLEQQFALSPLYWVGTVGSASSANVLKAYRRSDGVSLGSVNPDASTSIRSFGFIQPENPTPEQQQFQSLFADASSAPPKVTALISPLACQRSIDTDVTNLLLDPKVWTVEAIIQQGELQYLIPGSDWLVTDDQPGLRNGRRLLLKGYSARDARPHVPITLTFWG